MKTPPPEVWSTSVGTIPYKVTVLELATRKSVLYLKWRERGQWQYESLKNAAVDAGFGTGTLFDEKGARLVGRALAKKQLWAKERAEEKFARLRAGLTTDEKKKAKPLTLAETWPIISDPDTGQYIADSMHRREVKRELDNAVRILGGDTPWAAVKKDEIEKVYRTRIRELKAKAAQLVADGKEPITGIRAAEITVARILAVGEWLRANDSIPMDAALIPKGWKNRLADDWKKIHGADRTPEPHRPRHTLEEFKKLLGASWKLDPRLGLLLAIGAELRGGQVERARRTDLKIDLAGVKEQFVVPGAGNKGGAVVDLTPGQLASVKAALDPEIGYLRELEAAFKKGDISDYYLFPAGQLRGGRVHRTGERTTKNWHATRLAPATPFFPLERHAEAKPAVRRTLGAWFEEAEKIAGIKHVRGRGLYGMRRRGVDEAKRLGISREGLEEHGGWSDSQVPDSIYADSVREYAREEAARVRAQYRGEVSA